MISAHYRRVRQQLLAEPRTWLVTGVAGFIGSHLLEDLLLLGQTVIGLDDFSTGHQANLDAVLSRPLAGKAHFRMVRGDIRDLDTCRSACEGADYVLHHAALGSVQWSIDDPVRTNAVNVDGFVNMLVAAKDASVKRFVYASSSAVYGDSADSLQTEGRQGRPLSPYAASKLTNETYALAFQSSYGLETIGLRYFNVFGPRQDPAGAYAAVIPRWFDTMLRDERCRIFGDGTTTRDFCYVANVVQANILAATVGETDSTGDCYNIACAEAVSLNELFGMLRDRVQPYGLGPHYEPFRPGDVRHSCASIAKARRSLSYEPSHVVQQGLDEALIWYLKHGQPTSVAEELSTPRQTLIPASPVPYFGSPQSLTAS